MDKLTYAYNEIVTSSKKEQTVSYLCVYKHSKMDKFKKNYAETYKPYTEECILYDSKHMNFRQAMI